MPKPHSANEDSIMKSIQFIVLVAFACVVLLTLSSLRTEAPVDTDNLVADSVEDDRQRHLKALREAIKGRENLPAEQVFKDIKDFTGVPAARLLAIMNIGYSRSLGVSCGHCHNTDKWESDEKVQKQIAREMKKMMAGTNERLKTISGLKSAEPIVNCTTCHRGAVKPALDLK